MFAIILIVAVALSGSASWLSGVLIGAGHGPSSFAEITYGPYSLYVYAWPLLAVLASCKSLWARITALAGTLICYAWLLFLDGNLISRVYYDMERSFDRHEWLQSICLALILLLQASIWIPLLISLRAARGVQKA